MGELKVGDIIIYKDKLFRVTINYIAVGIAESQDNARMVHFDKADTDFKLYKGN
jgi:hypothetical protein